MFLCVDTYCTDSRTSRVFPHDLVLPLCALAMKKHPKKTYWWPASYMLT